MMKRILIPMMALVMVCGLADAAEHVFPNRLKDAKVGEWALIMHTAGPSMGQRERFTVTEVKGEGEFAVVVVRRETVDDDGTVEDKGEVEINQMRFADRLSDMEDKASQVSRERMIVGERELTLWSMTWEQETDDGETHEYTIWASDDLPVGGFYKSWSSDPDFSAVEVIEYGQ